MKFFNRTIVLMLVLSTMSFTKSANIYDAHQDKIPSNFDPYVSSMTQFAVMSMKDMAQLKGAKLTLKEKVQFKTLQFKARKQLLTAGSSMDSSWWLWFVIGLLLGPIGWLIAILFSDGNGKPALIGCLISLLLWGGGWLIV
jgi:hypothetical protein